MAVQPDAALAFSRVRADQVAPYIRQPADMDERIQAPYR